MKPLRFLPDVLRSRKPTDVAERTFRSKSAIRFVAKIAVDPVPNPTTIPDWTNFTAYSAACCLSFVRSSSCSGKPDPCIGTPISLRLLGDQTQCKTTSDRSSSPAAREHRPPEPNSIVNILLQTIHGLAFFVLILPDRGPTNTSQLRFENIPPSAQSY